MSYKSFDPPLDQEKTPDEEVAVAQVPTPPARRGKKRRPEFDNRRDVRIKKVLSGRREVMKIRKAKCRVRRAA